MIFLYAPLGTLTTLTVLLVVSVVLVTVDVDGGGSGGDGVVATVWISSDPTQATVDDSMDDDNATTDDDDGFAVVDNEKAAMMSAVSVSKCSSPRPGANNPSPRNISTYPQLYLQEEDEDDACVDDSLLFSIDIKRNGNITFLPNNGSTAASVTIAPINSTKSRARVKRDMYSKRDTV